MTTTMTAIQPMSPFVGPPLPRRFGVVWPWLETDGDKSAAAGIIRGLVNHTINDITFEQMNRIVRRINGLSTADRAIPVKVATIIADELGPTKALTYVEKSFKNGNISFKDYTEMRAALILPMPKAEVPRETATGLARELIEAQQRLRRALEELPTPSKSDVLRAGEVDKEVQKIRRVWKI